MKIWNKLLVAVCYIICALYFSSVELVGLLSRVKLMVLRTVVFLIFIWTFTSKLYLQIWVFLVLTKLYWCVLLNMLFLLFQMKELEHWWCNISNRSNLNYCKYCSSEDVPANIKLVHVFVLHSWWSKVAQWKLSKFQ